MRAIVSRAADDVAEAECAGVAAVGAADFVLERVDAQRVLDRDLQALGADRLDHEIDSAGAHGRDDRLDRAVRGLHDGRNGDVALAHAFEHAHAVEVGHDEVENEQIDRRAVGAPRGAPAPLRRLQGFDLVAEPPRHGFEQAALDRIVVGNRE